MLQSNILLILMRMDSIKVCVSEEDANSFSVPVLMKVLFEAVS